MLTEGSAGSGNSYDSQLMTVGRGFGVQGGQGAAVLNAFFSADASAKSALLHVGFTVEGTTAVVVDTEHQVVLRGDAALKYITLNKAIYSQLANTAESPAHIDKMSDAQFGVMRDNAAKIPQEVFDGGHLCGTGSEAEQGGAQAGATAQCHDHSSMECGRHAFRCPPQARGWWDHLEQDDHRGHRFGRTRRHQQAGRVDSAASAATLGLRRRTAVGWRGKSRMLEWGEHLVGKQLSKIAKLPDAATVPAGTRYFAVTGGFKVWSAGVSLASE
ncbi:hypothetical protein [Fodinicola feengrottensis]|uniref:hypothetical protein n=1 Tax=Fodinicola feengrottensis TaxID=435914 RepID=UPI0013D1286D|nr:hypothetical protein [Fodinicola feengrottensis]